MKRLLAISMLVNVVMLAVVGLLSKGRMAVVHAAGGGGGGSPVGNGDVNGDGSIDISDAVYTLSWLFTGGPAPVAIEAPPPAVKGLPATGQTKCNGHVEGQGWTEVPCEQEACQRQDAQNATGCPNEGRFTDNGDGTVTDNCTGLMWQRDTTDVNADGQVLNDGSDAPAWCDALAYCESLIFAGYNDWRLPNVRELQSIVDYGRVDPAIDPVFGAMTMPYWSSTSSANFPHSAWYVRFGTGFAFEIVKVDRNFVRAVRTAP